MQDSLPTISVVIPNYNYARFLPNAIDSVLAQRSAFLDIVVVDDGSTDNSLEVLSPYRDLVTVVEQDNQGQIGACLAGLRATNADYVYFLDADDFIDESFTSTLIPALKDWPVKVQFQLESVDQQRQSLGSVFPAFPTPYTSTQMKADNRSMGFYQCPPTSGNVFHIETLLSINLHADSMPAYIDAVAALVMPHLGSVVTIESRLAYYRIHTSNISDWSKPTPELMQREIDSFKDNWAEAVRILELEEAPFGSKKPLYTLERELIIGGLENRPWLASTAAAYVRRLWSANLPFSNKLLLTTWAFGLIAPIATVRRSLILKRRSPIARSPMLQAFITRILHGTAVIASRCKTPHPSNQR